MAIAIRIFPSVTLRWPVIVWPSTVMVSSAVNSSNVHTFPISEPADEEVLQPADEGQSSSAMRIPPTSAGRQAIQLIHGRTSRRSN